jgi:NAD(P)-dependent dehydrogenase (short-subunit alcohol dehydrogenase family)
LRTVLVTGASTGIGAACATHFVSRGCRVLAGVRQVGDAPEGTEEMLLDVTDGAQIADAASRVDRLDGLVNNAGIVVACPLEFLPLEELRHQLEVNVVGQLAVTQAFLPAIRAARGRIVIVGSIAGKSALPFLGAYAMSKHALEAMADSMRVELAPDGIHVSIVEPGTIATPIWTKPRPLLDTLPAEAGERYGSRMDAFRRMAAKRAAGAAAPPETVVRAIEHALTASRPKTRYLVGRDAKLRSAIERLPDRERDRLLSRLLLGNSGR